MTGIDAHQHYWQPKRGDYDWMPMDNAILARSYSPSDLAGYLASNNISKTILVQAAASVVETEYMLGIADATDSVAGVVGWIDFENRDDLHHIRRLSSHPKFLGVRPMIQDIPDVNWMLRDDVQWGFQAICELDLTLDALGFPIHLDNFLTLLNRYENMRVVIDHCMKPQIRDHGDGPHIFRQWADGMSRLADETAAYCKLSGIVTEANEDWTIDDLRPYAGHALNSFGADRVMWGSDWPVCQLRASYDEWLDAAQKLTADLSTEENAMIFGGAAAKFYRLND